MKVMDARFVLYGMLIPGLAGIAAMAAVLLPGGARDLTVPRLLAGGGAYLLAQLAVSWIVGYLYGRSTGRTYF